MSDRSRSLPGKPNLRCLKIEAKPTNLIAGQQQSLAGEERGQRPRRPRSEVADDRICRGPGESLGGHHQAGVAQDRDCAAGMAAGGNGRRGRPPGTAVRTAGIGHKAGSTRPRAVPGSSRRAVRLYLAPVQTSRPTTYGDR